MPVHPGPTPYILLTQGHVDHVGGVELFREPGTQLVAQANNEVCQRDDERIKVIRYSVTSIWFKEAIAATERIMADSNESISQDIPTPDILFEDRHDIDIGGLAIRLLSVPGGETIDSTAIWLPQHKIVFTGNMFGPIFPHFPQFQYDPWRPLSLRRALSLLTGSGAGARA